MQLFSTYDTIFLTKHEKTDLKSCPIFFFSIANWPKTSPNLNFCSIKNV